MIKILAITLLVFFSLKIHAQEYILNKSKDDIKTIMADAKYPIIQSGESSGIKFDSFNCGNEIEMLCYYNSDNICTRVRQLISNSSLNDMIKELNYSDIKIKEKPYNWINIKKTMRIQLYKIKGQNKFALDYSLIP